jgi:hypothetical protein
MPIYSMNPVRLVGALLLLVAAGAVMAETPEERLAAAGYTLPDPTSPVATYVSSR